MGLNKIIIVVCLRNYNRCRSQEFNMDLNHVELFRPRHLVIAWSFSCGFGPISMPHDSQQSAFSKYDELFNSSLEDEEIEEEMSLYEE